MIQEAFHEKKIAEIAAQIAAKPEQKIVLIAGPVVFRQDDLFSQAFDAALSLWTEAASDCRRCYFVDREKTPRDAMASMTLTVEAIDAVQLNAV